MILKLPSPYLIYPHCTVDCQGYHFCLWKWQLKKTAYENKSFITSHLSLSSTSPTSGYFYFQKEQVIMEPKLEPGPETVLRLHPIQSEPLTFLSSPSVGSGSLDRQGKTRTEQESPGGGGKDQGDGNWDCLPIWAWPQMCSLCHSWLKDTMLKCASGTEIASSHVAGVNRDKEMKKLASNHRAAHITWCSLGPTILSTHWDI